MNGELPEMAADDWIAMRKCLADEPAVLGIAARLNLDVDTVVGKLHRVWSWADSRTSTGRVSGCTFDTIDIVARTQSFASAMESEKWLSRGEDGTVTFPRWNKYNPKSAKKRSLAAQRQAKKRARDKRDSVTHLSRSQRDCHATTEQDITGQIQEENQGASAHTHSPSLHAAAPSVCEIDGGAVRLVLDDEPPPPGLEPSTNPGADGPIPFRLVKRLGELYPRQVALEEAYPEIQGAIRRIAKARGCDIRAACTWLAARVSAYAGSDEAKAEQRFIPFPARWFAQGRYNDEDGAWRRSTPGSDAPAPDAIPAALARSLARGEQA